MITKGSTTTRRIVEDLPLSYFILRAQSLKLYRQTLKQIQQIQRVDTRREVRLQIREHFEQYKNNRDVEKGKRGLAEARSQIKYLEQLISMSQ